MADNQAVIIDPFSLGGGTPPIASPQLSNDSLMDTRDKKYPDKSHEDEVLKAAQDEPEKQTEDEDKLPRDVKPSDDSTEFSDNPVISKSQRDHLERIERQLEQLRDKARLEGKDKDKPSLQEQEEGRAAPLGETSSKKKDEEEDEEEKSPEELGLEDAAKETVKNYEIAQQKLDSLVEKSQNVLFHFKSIFPLDLIPDEVVVDLTKVTVLHKDFFGVQRTHSIFIKDIVDVFVTTDLFFAVLHIVDAGFVENEVIIDNLRKKDAYKARRIIQGLVVATRNDVDIAKLEGPDILEKLEALGESNQQG